MTDGISLIGMPCSGKTTTAKIIADTLNCKWLDVDQWMNKHENAKSTSEIINVRGSDYALNLEQRCVEDNDLHGLVLSTPGSIIYTSSLDKLSSQTIIFYLDTPLDIIKSRLSYDPNNKRGVIGLGKLDLNELYAERTPLYRKWADHIIDCESKDPNEIADEIIKIYKRN